MHHYLLIYLLLKQELVNGVNWLTHNTLLSQMYVKWLKGEAGSLSSSET